MIIKIIIIVKIIIIFVKIIIIIKIVIIVKIIINVIIIIAEIIIIKIRIWRLSDMIRVLLMVDHRWPKAPLVPAGRCHVAEGHPWGPKAPSSRSERARPAGA